MLCAILFTRGVLTQAYRGWVTLSWVEQPAQIVNVKVEHKQFKNHSQRTYYDRYKLHVNYRYEHNGKTFSSDRVGLVDKWGGEDVLRYGAELEEAQKSGKPIAIYVNPSEPSEAVITKDFKLLKWMLLSGVSNLWWFLAYKTYSWLRRIE